MASENLNVGTAANANDGDTLRAAFIKVKKMFAEVYGQTYSEQGDLSGDTFEIKEDKLKATNTAVDGYVLTYDSATGGFTWEQKFDGDITGIVAGDGLTGDATSGDASLAVGAGTGITVNADDIQIADGGVDTTQLADNAVTADKLADSINSEIAANTAKVTNATHTGDVTGSTALTIANDVVDYDKLAGEFTTASPLTAAADLDVDFSTAAVFTTTSSGPMDLNFTNAGIGQVKTIIVTDSGGTSSLTFDTGTNTVVKLNGDYSATAGAVNYIQAQCIAANSFILTISQAAA